MNLNISSLGKFIWKSQAVAGFGVSESLIYGVRDINKVKLILLQYLIVSHYFVKSFQYQQVRNKWANWMMIRDVKRRRLSAEHFLDRTRVNALRKNDILPVEIREVADAEIKNFALNAHPMRINNRCVITSR